MTSNPLKNRQLQLLVVWCVCAVYGQAQTAVNSAVSASSEAVATPDVQYLASPAEATDQSTVVLEEAANRATAFRSLSSCGCGEGDGSGRRYRNPFWCNPYGDIVLDPCDRHACAECGSATPPRFYATAELVPLFRDQKDDRPFQTLGRGGPEVLDTGSFKTEFDAGMRLLLGVALHDQYRLEGEYLGPFEWNSRRAVRSSNRNGIGNLFSPFTNFGRPLPRLGLDFNNFASIEMESKFNSVELNLRRLMILPTYPWLEGRPPCVANSFLVGVRHMTLDERFGYVTNSSLPAGGSINRADITTENEMIGVQIGMQSQILLLRGQGYVDFGLKGGIYHNEMFLQSAYQFSDGSGTVIDEFVGSESLDRTTFLGEISLSYVRQVTTHLTCRVGYNAFWLTGVALASGNMDTNINLLEFGPAQLHHRDNVVLHGPTIGLTFAY